MISFFERKLSKHALCEKRRAYDTEPELSLLLALGYFLYTLCCSSLFQNNKKKGTCIISGRTKNCCFLKYRTKSKSASGSGFSGSYSFTFTVQVYCSCSQSQKTSCSQSTTKTRSWYGEDQAAFD